jgi:hypothetical protein
VPGRPALNRLRTANLHLAADVLLARTTLAAARAYSDPDLPRLWIFANGLHHAVPAEILTTIPARSHGPIAQLIPTHDDLTAWPGIRNAVEHLQVTVDAARQGRQWLTGRRARMRTTSMDRHRRHLIALGVLHLTHPSTAPEILLHQPTRPDPDVLRQIVATLPPITSILDLSDPALKSRLRPEHLAARNTRRTRPP